jgi:hypothetical protein
MEMNLSSNNVQAAWLAQAEWILEDIEQKHGDWIDLHILPNIRRAQIHLVLFSSRIEMTLEAPGPRLTAGLTRDMYLFIAPVVITQIDSTPYFSFNPQPYFWSFDENGAQPMSRTTQELLGLPSFEATVTGGRQWSTTEHKAVSQYLKLKGFSSGLRYARKQGYPLFEAAKSMVESDEFEIIETVSDSECLQE